MSSRIRAKPAPGSSSSTATTATWLTTSCGTLRSSFAGGPGATSSRTTPCALSDRDTSWRPSTKVASGPFPHDNRVTAGSVFNAEACVELDGASNNRVERLTIDDVCIPVRPAGALDPALGNVVDLQQTHQEQLAARAAVQVATNTRVVKPGDILRLGLAVRNGPFNEPLDLYVGIFLPDNQIAFFSSPGLGNLSIPASARSMQLVSKGASLAMPRFVEVQLPPGAPPGTYQFF